MTKSLTNLTPSGVERDRWQPIESAPHAMTVLACRFDDTCGEWVYGVVVSPPSYPFTHWRPLPADPLGMSDQELGRVDPALVNHAPAGHGPMGFDPAREQLDAWLEAHCGRGLPYADATDLPSALHGLAYLLRQIEGTNSYKVFVGQCGPATSALRWALDHFAREALASDSGRLPQGEKPKALSAEQARAAAQPHRPASISQSERVSRLEEALDACMSAFNGFENWRAQHAGLLVVPADEIITLERLSERVALAQRMAIKAAAND